MHTAINLGEKWKPHKTNFLKEVHVFNNDNIYGVYKHIFNLNARCAND